jgi:hypothetical protein
MLLSTEGSDTERPVVCVTCARLNVLETGCNTVQTSVAPVYL